LLFVQSSSCPPVKLNNARLLGGTPFFPFFFQSPPRTLQHYSFSGTGVFFPPLPSCFTWRSSGPFRLPEGFSVPFFFYSDLLQPNGAYSSFPHISQIFPHPTISINTFFFPFSPPSVSILLWTPFPYSIFFKAPFPPMILPHYPPYL